MPCRSGKTCTRARTCRSAAFLNTGRLATYRGIVLRRAALVVVAGIALSGAAFLATAKLTLHGHYHCDLRGALPDKCNPYHSYWVADRAAWQLPVAIVIAAVGVGAAILLRRGRKQDLVQ
jgi:hypothetical protein